MANFRIVDGESDDLLGIDYDEIKQDYLNPNTTVSDIKKKYNISNGRYSRIKQKIVEDTGVARKPTNLGGVSPINKVMKHITQDPLTGKYRVAKYRNGTLKHYGRYSTLEEAKLVRDVLVSMDWDWDFYVNNIKPHYFSSKIDESYDDIYNEFKKDYLEGMPMKELLPKYGLSKYRYYQLSTSIKHEMGLERKPTRVMT